MRPKMLKFKTSSSIHLSKLFKSKLIKKYLLDREGIAAIEFVFVAPIMIGMYFGLAEISTAISADRRISHATNVAGDLTTQAAVITAADMGEVMTATTLVMGVPTNRLSAIKMEIASFSRDVSGAVVPLGTATLNGPFPKTFNADQLDKLILSDTSGVVVARVSYDYEPLKLQYFNTNITLDETFLLKPRKSATVVFDDGTGATTDFTCSITIDNKASCS